MCAAGGARSGSVRTPRPGPPDVKTADRLHIPWHAVLLALALSLAAHAAEARATSWTPAPPATSAFAIAPDGGSGAGLSAPQGTVKPLRPITPKKSLSHKLRRRGSPEGGHSPASPGESPHVTLVPLAVAVPIRPVNPRSVLVLRNLPPRAPPAPSSAA